MAFSRSSVLLFGQLFCVVSFSFGGDDWQPAASWAGTRSHQGVLALRRAIFLRLRVYDALSDVGSTSVTPLAISSASALLLLCRSSASALLFLHRPRYDSFHFSFKTTKPLRFWNPPSMRSSDVKSALRQTIIITVVALWWCEVWEKYEVVNCERVVRNADSLSPLLVVVNPLYSCADDSDWMSTTYDVFDAEHITIGIRLTQVEYNINNQKPPLFLFSVAILCISM